MKKKQLLTLFLTALLTGGMLVGCGSQNAAEQSSTGGSASASSTPTFKIATVRWADWGEKYHEGFPDQSAKEDGIQIDWETILNSDWGDKKAVTLAGSDLPDAFLGSNALSESDIEQNKASFLVLDDYVEKDMPNLKKILDSDPVMKNLATSADGHIYGLPAKRPCRPVVGNQVFINKKWLDNLGLSMPTTFDEYLNVLKAFKEKDANGNGDPNDEIPYGKGYADPFYFFALPFGTNIGADGTYAMAIKDNAPVFLPVTDSYKQGIEAMHKAYEAGLIDPEIFTEDDSMRDSKLMSKTPVIGSAAGWTTDSTFGANADQYVPLPALKGPDGKQYVASDPQHYNYSRYEFLVTNKCKDPDALLKWIDGFYTEDASIQNYYGGFDKAVKKNSDGTYEVLKPDDDSSADTFAWVNSLRDFGPKYVGEDFNSKVKYESENGDASKLAVDKDFVQYAKPAFPNVSYTQEQLQNLATLYTDISNYVDSSQADWVTKGGVDKGWDAYNKQLQSMGLDKFLEIQKDAYTKSGAK